VAVRIAKVRSAKNRIAKRRSAKKRSVKAKAGEDFMAKINAGLACPICDASGITSELYQSTPSLAILCEKDSEHKWTDTNALYAARPRRLAVAPKAAAVQPNHVPVTLSVPAHTEQALKAKYGEKLATSLTSVLQACAEPEMMILNATELERIRQRTGIPTSSAELFGNLFALGEEVKSLKMEIERLNRTVAIRRKGSDEGVIIDLGAQLPKAVAKAADSGYDLEDFIGNYVRDSIENDWIVVSA
jgi:hypothetical protein